MFLFHNFKIFYFQTVAMEAIEEADRQHEQCELTLFAEGKFDYFGLAKLTILKFLVFCFLCLGRKARCDGNR